MPSVLTALPIQIALQLIDPGNCSLANSTPLAGTSLLRHNAVIPNGYTAYPDIGVAMKYYGNDLTWNLARKHCIAEGGNLAVIDSIQKAQYGDNLRQANPRGPLLGIHKLFDNTEWVSAKTGLPMGFIPWRAAANRTPEGFSCTALWGDLGGRVGDFNCNTSWSHLCEVSLFQEYKSEV